MLLFLIFSSKKKNNNEGLKEGFGDIPRKVDR